MRGLNPADVPRSGERYTFRRMKTGMMGPEKNPAISAMIDAGPLQGKRINCPCPADPGERFSATVYASYTALIDGVWTKVHPDYTDTNPRIRYTLADFGPPEDEAEITPEPRTTDRFKRR